MCVCVCERERERYRETDRDCMNRERETGCYLPSDAEGKIVYGPLFVCLHDISVRHTDNFIFEPIILKRDHVQ